MRTPTIDFVGNSRRWIAISGALLLLSVLAFGIRGLDLSIDFVGGNSYQLVDVRGDVTAEELRRAAEDAGATDVIAQLQTSDGATTGAQVRTESLEPASPTELAVRQALQETAGAAEVGFDFVGPVWGQRITRQAIEALLVFLVVVILYITFRLEFKMAVASIAALVHDVFITLGIYALVGFNVSPATVIALLTILGYSLYDSVIVFDRVKENAINLGDPGLRTFGELVNASMNQVVYRSINTSITSLLPVGALLLLGAQVLGATTLQDLALALFIGMAIGVYSSLFVAGPLFAWMKRSEPEEQRRIAKAAEQDAAGGEQEAAVEVEAPAPGSPEARAPITTDYVRGTGKAKKRRKR
ncbi:MAG: protein translocase subunit SecF [Nitriliruptoraceae bacterium]